MIEDNRPLITFVILHYLALQETLECIESIENSQKYENYRIIVVDNGSGISEDIEILQKQVNRYKNVELIISEKNMGFAQGNNIGFMKAKYEYKSDFIILLNNDTLIKQNDFCDVIVKKHLQYAFAVAGPQIELKDGSILSNPMVPGRYILYRQRLAQIKIIFLYLLSYVNLDCKKKSETVQSSNLEFHINESQNQKLHGCCLIFSREYIDKFDGLNPNTFLYLEEDILVIRLRNHGMLSLYTPELKIIHMEDAATNKIGMKAVKKRRFIYKNTIKSYNALISEIKSKF